MKLDLFKHVHSHPRDRLKRAVAALNERLDELQFTKQTPVHPRDRLRKSAKLRRRSIY